MVFLTQIKKFFTCQKRMISFILFRTFSQNITNRRDIGESDILSTKLLAKAAKIFDVTWRR